MLILFALINIRLTVTESQMNRPVLASRFRKLVRPAGAKLTVFDGAEDTKYST